MHIVCIVEARMESSRLPAKTLVDIWGKTALQRVIDRISISKSINKVCIATSINKSDDIIENKCNEWGIHVFRGSEGDVLDRVLKAAKFFKADVIVRAGADNIFVDPFLIDRLVEIHNTGNYDLVVNDIKKTFPVGIFAHVLKTDLLEKIEPLAKTEQERDDVDRYIWERLEQYKLFNLEANPDERMPELRITMDYPEDLELIKILYGNMALNNKFYKTSDLVAYVRNNSDLLKINSHCIQKSAPWLKNEDD